jgi:hypothetical protein
VNAWQEPASSIEYGEPRHAGSRTKINIQKHVPASGKRVHI